MVGMGEGGEEEQRTRAWFLLCQEAITALFHIHPCPDKVTALVLRQMYARLGAGGAGGSGDDANHCDTEGTDAEGVEGVEAEEEGAEASPLPASASACALSRLLFVLGQVYGLSCMVSECFYAIWFISFCPLRVSGYILLLSHY
jgi:hypothetical protein